MARPPFFLYKTIITVLGFHRKQMTHLCFKRKNAFMLLIYIPRLPEGAVLVPFLIGADGNQVSILLVQAQHIGMGGRFPVFPPHHIHHKPGYAGPDINGREMVLIGKLAAQYNMPVQDTPDRVRYGFIGVIPFHQHCVDAVMEPLLKLPLPL